MRRSAMVRALGVTTRPSVHRISALFVLGWRTSFSGVICPARAAVSMLLPARRTGSSRSCGRGAQLRRRAECCRGRYPDRRGGGVPFSPCSPVAVSKPTP
jgi:hypothetical protein